MKKLFKYGFRLSVFTLLVAGWTLALGSLHVVLSPGSLPGVGRVTVVPKDRIHWRETFVDTRTWTAIDLANHPGVASRLVETYNGHVLNHVGMSSAEAEGEVESGVLASADIDE